MQRDIAGPRQKGPLRKYCRSPNEEMMSLIKSEAQAGKKETHLRNVQERTEHLVMNVDTEVGRGWG